MTTHARIAALLRELADAFDDLDTAERPKRRRERRGNDAASVEAVRRVQAGLRRKGTVSEAS